MSVTAEVEAQAKVNLRLAILARERGGYHQIETLFLRIALSDTVRVRRTVTGRSLDVRGVDDPATLGAVEQNLAWRAADAYLHATAGAGGFAIELEKCIPVGGGLGGGSADAGAVLRAMDALAPTPLGEPALLRLAATLGADVPFLASTQPFAVAWGRGERMLGVEPPAVRPLVLVVPSFGVNTAQAYGWVATARGEPAASHAELLAVASLREWTVLTRIATNDFEPVVGERHPEIPALVAALRHAGCSMAMMSGSGSVVFGVCSREDVTGELVQSRLRDMSPRLRVIVSATADRVEPVRMLD